MIRERGNSKNLPFFGHYFVRSWLLWVPLAFEHMLIKPMRKKQAPHLNKLAYSSSFVKFIAILLMNLLADKKH